MAKEREKILSLLKSIVEESLEDLPVNIYLFGSWARKEEKRTSDIDIALEAKVEIPINIWVELREKIEESSLPYHVDLVDLSKANPKIIQKVKEEGIKWRDYKKEYKAQPKH